MIPMGKPGGAEFRLDPRGEVRSSANENEAGAIGHFDKEAVVISRHVGCVRAYDSHDSVLNGGLIIATSLPPGSSDFLNFSRWSQR